MEITYSDILAESYHGILLNFSFNTSTIKSKQKIDKNIVKGTHLEF